MRHQGKVNESLQYFQAATSLSPHNVLNLKQVARSLYLLGKHRAAVDVYEETTKLGFEVRRGIGGWGGEWEGEERGEAFNRVGARGTETPRGTQRGTQRGTP